MTEETTETRTVQQYRHEARRNLNDARSRLKFRTDATAEIYSRLNGAISEVLRGRTGLTQEQQVEHLNEARNRVQESLIALPDLIAQAKAELTEQIEASLAQIESDAKRAVETLSEAAAFAEQRDFDAHQQRKAQNAPVYDDYSEDYDDEEDDDF